MATATMEKLKKILRLLSPWSCIKGKKNPFRSFRRSSRMKSSSPPTTLIIAHGAFQTQFHYQLFIDAVKTQTSIDRVLCPQQCSSGNAPPPDCFDRDVELIHETARNELINGRDILLICHSYGGIPGCEGLADLPEKAEDGNRLGRVLGILFVSAFVAEAGQSLVTSKMAGRASWVRVDGALSHVVSPGPTLFNATLSKSPKLAATLISRLVPQASASFMALTKHETWKDHACYYLRCGSDQAMEPVEQDYFIARLLQGSPGAKIKHLPQSDHAPFASFPDALAGVVEEVVGELRAER